MPKTDLILNEIEWCKEHQGESKRGKDWEDGFVQGLIQAYRLMAGEIRDAQPATKGHRDTGGYAPPNGAFDLPHAIDCVRKRYGLPPKPE